MLETLNDHLTHIIESSGWLAPLAALAGGLLTAANPCVIAAVPLMVGFVAGQAAGGVKNSAARSFLLSLTFSAGLTITFFLMYLTTLAIRSVIPIGAMLYAAAAVCFIMGLHLLGVLDFRLPAPKGATPTRRGFVGALLLGMMFGLISLPCAGPILLALLSIVSVKGTVYGGTLLVAYSLGHCGLILVGGTSIGLAQRMIDSRGLQTANLWLKRVAGGLVIAVGIWALTQTP